MLMGRTMERMQAQPGCLFWNPELQSQEAPPLYSFPKNLGSSSFLLWKSSLKTLDNRSPPTMSSYFFVICCCCCVLVVVWENLCQNRCVIVDKRKPGYELTESQDNVMGTCPDPVWCGFCSDQILVGSLVTSSLWAPASVAPIPIFLQMCMHGFLIIHFHFFLKNLSLLIFWVVYAHQPPWKIARGHERLHSMDSGLCLMSWKPAVLAVTTQEPRIQFPVQPSSLWYAFLPSANTDCARTGQSVIWVQSKSASSWLLVSLSLPAGSWAFFQLQT